MNRDHIDDLKGTRSLGQVADALNLPGTGNRRFCPTCQTGPDHKTPDLSLGDGVWNCFKCGKAGDIIALIQHARDTDFRGAVAWLEELTGHRSDEDPKTPPRATKTPSETIPPGTVEAVLGAFLAACRPVEGPARDWVQGKVPTMTDELVHRLGLRCCGREYADVVRHLRDDHGDAALLAAGLLKRKGDRAVPVFWHYYASKAGFLVVPYLRKGRPVFLKARPPVSKDAAERRGLVRFLNTAGRVPCPYNADALSGRPDKILICEGETDTWAALAAGYAAVGIPGARNVKPDWIDAFRGIPAVYLALDADGAGKEGERIIASLFRSCGLPPPLSLPIPPGRDLTDYLTDGISE